MTKWTGVLGGGAAGAAVVVAGYVGLTVSGVLVPETPDAPPTAMISPDPAETVVGDAPGSKDAAVVDTVPEPEAPVPASDEPPAEPEAPGPEVVEETAAPEAPEVAVVEEALEPQVEEETATSEVAVVEETPEPEVEEETAAPEAAAVVETPEPEASADVVEEETAAPEVAAVEETPEPEAPADVVVEVTPDPEEPSAAVEPETPAEEGVEVVSEPEPAPDQTAEVTPEPEVSLDEITEDAPEPEAPVEETVTALPEPEVPVSETAEAAPEPEPQDTDESEPAPAETAEIEAVPETVEPASDNRDAETMETAETPDAVTEAVEDTGAPQPEPPTFDLIRVEQDGTALVAGKGAPRAEVTIFLDGDEIAEALAGTDGKFASLMDIAPSTQPRLMTLSMTVGGDRIFSETEIIVAPFGPKPEPLAEAEGAETPDDIVVVDAGTEPEATDADPSQEPDAQPEETAETVTPPVAEAVEQPTTTPETEDPEPQDAPIAEAETVQEEVPDVAQVETPTPAPDNAEATDTPSDTDTEIAETPQPADTAETVTAEDSSEEAPTPAADTPTETTERETPVLPTPETPPETEAPPTLLASDEDGVRVLPGPEVLDRVAIDSISYDDAGDVALAGRGAGSQGGGFVRVYLDNTPITTSRIRADGSWRVTLPEVDKGVYVLRVDEVDDEGEVKSRAETPFQREDRETLEKAAEGNGGGPVKILTVQPGNTLWQIARERYGQGILYVRVFDANRSQIRDPDLIYPGQVFDLPEPDAPVED